MSQKITKYFCLVVVLFLFPSLTQAAPSVNSASRVGGDMVISGSSFGSHPDYNSSQPFLNVAWNDFEDRVMAKNGFTLTNTYNNWRIASDNNRPNSKYYAEKVYNGHRGTAIGLKQSERFSVYYYTFWFKLRANTQSGKFTRIWGGPNNMNVYLSTGDNNTMIRGNFEYSPLGGGTQWSSPNSFGSETWRRVEIVMDVPKQTYTVWMDGVKQWTRTNWVPNTFNGTLGNRIWEVGGMIDDPKASGGKDGGYNYDDLYFSGTQARVEICKASTWGARSICEIQIPKKWNTSSITVQARNGSFKTGDRAYLYVVDANGAVSNGLPITIGAGGNTTNPIPDPTPPDPTPGEDTTPPAVPTGLRVQ